MPAGQGANAIAAGQQLFGKILTQKSAGPGD
jgi:hypothetical protein